MRKAINKRDYRIGLLLDLIKTYQVFGISFHAAALAACADAIVLPPSYLIPPDTEGRS